jgi:hypothetical protein
MREPITSKLVEIRFPKTCEKYLKQLRYPQVLKIRLFSYDVSWASSLLPLAMQVSLIPVALMPTLSILSYESYYYNDAY